MPKNIEELDENQSQIDIEAATAEISSDLFGEAGEVDKHAAATGEQGGEPSGEGRDAPGVDAVSPPAQTEKPAGEEASPSSQVETPAPAGDNSAEVQAIGAPKTWNKEELATWATIPPELQAKLAPVLARREEDFLRGITQYKADAEVGQSYQKVVAPYAPILAAENIDPVQMFQSFASNHYLLSRGTTQEKVQIAAALMEGYKIPLAELLNHLAEHGGAPKPVDPEVQALRSELAEIKTGLTTRQQVEQEAVAQRLGEEVTAFASDPAHPYFEEVADDITRLFQSRQASTLAEAYEKAVYLNPVTRQKEIDRLTAERTSVAQNDAEKIRQKVATSTADQVRTTPKSRNGTVPATGSIDDTLNETMAAIAGRG